MAPYPVAWCAYCCMCGALVERGGDRLCWPLAVQWTAELDMRSEWRAHLYGGRPYGRRHISWQTFACGSSRCALWCASVMVEQGAGNGMQACACVLTVVYAVLHFMKNLVNSRANRSREGEEERALYEERNRAPVVRQIEPPLQSQSAVRTRRSARLRGRSWLLIYQLKDSQHMQCP